MSTFSASSICGGTPPLDFDAMRDHHAALYGATDAGHLASGLMPDKRTTWVDAGDVEAVITALYGWAAAAISTTASAFILRRWGTLPWHCGGVCAIPGLWADVDIAGPVTRARTARLMPRAAWRLIRAAFPLPPSYIVGSGGGLHALLVAARALAFADDDERRHAARLVRMLQWLIVAEGAETRLARGLARRPLPCPAFRRHDQPQARRSGAPRHHSAGREPALQHRGPRAHPAAR